MPLLVCCRPCTSWRHPTPATRGGEQPSMFHDASAKRLRALGSRAV
ncbi:hypothetical protein A176_005664 [Myxococcus hansupus]|uniref:Uncharacterized protein n=1 Tax=Pseudomyxococcus hansupus TaxID=1297742 RepID=A0A0H4XKH5_9BACT|nr:hypothetical protein A176_005664 [Myxococcus hansupus]